MASLNKIEIHHLSITAKQRRQYLRESYLRKTKMAVMWQRDCDNIAMKATKPKPMTVEQWVLHQADDTEYISMLVSH